MFCSSNFTHLLCNFIKLHSPYPNYNLNHFILPGSNGYLTDRFSFLRLWHRPSWEDCKICYPLILSTFLWPPFLKRGVTTPVCITDFHVMSHKACQPRQPNNNQSLEKLGVNLMHIGGVVYLNHLLWWESHSLCSQTLFCLWMILGMRSSSSYSFHCPAMSCIEVSSIPFPLHAVSARSCFPLLSSRSFVRIT